VGISRILRIYNSYATFEMKLLLYIFLLITPTIVLSNAAAPGFWGAGGMGRFSLLYPEDSASYKHIQMVKEKISIELYKGYAVVKGEYWMFNHSNKAVSIKVGYPINSDYDNWTKDGRKISILLNSLNNLKVYSNSQTQKIISEPVMTHKETWENNNWYIWKNIFQAKDTTLIQVYFIVNTNETSISEGYNRDHTNGFIYILESGATWKQPIINGEIRIKLNDNLKLKDIKGIRPDSIFSIKDYIILTKFNNLTPTPDNNIIIAYSDKIDDFNFDKILERDSLLYNSVNIFSKMTLSEKDFKSLKFEDAFRVHSQSGGIFVVTAMIFYFLGIPILIIVLVIILIIYLRRRNKRKRNVA
jgi:hypothetical protein